MSLHTSVDFSSVYVVINLQTWVLLFDYLGIGVPTPPPSRPSSAEPHDGGPLQTFEPPPSLSVNPESTLLAESGALASALERSLLEDAMDFTSLGSGSTDIEIVRSSKVVSARDEDFKIESTQAAATYLTMKDSLLELGEEKTAASGGTTEKTTDDRRTSASKVWGVEGKMAVAVSLNVKSLTVTFNKPEHPLARGSVNSLSAELQLLKGNVKISGSLGQASVVDLTETGAFYRERYAYNGACSGMWQSGTCSTFFVI